MREHHYCECGCGTLIIPIDKQGRKVRFTRGHNEKTGKKTNTAKYCDFCGSDKQVCFNAKTERLLCAKHRNQISKHGKLIKTNREPNKIVVNDNYAEIVMCDSNGNERARTKIDLIDIDLAKKHKWFMQSGGGYVTAKKHESIPKYIYLHRLILDAPSNLCIDHINHDPLDNRRDNLRLVTKKENSHNLPTRNVWGCPGLMYKEKHSHFAVQIGVNGKTQYLGIGETLEDAIKIRINGEMQYWGCSPTLEQRGKTNV